MKTQDTLALKARFRAKLTPLLMLLTLAVAIGAPVGVTVLEMRRLRGSCSQTASILADALAPEAATRPVLWRYDSIKLLEHLVSYEAEPDVSQV
ncbi:MAG: hypothetical protein KC561_19855, partial [Myxococcales bacterium]|nr:hypothetical protein [Myxococcales bacterium]